MTKTFRCIMAAALVLGLTSAFQPPAFAAGVEQATIDHALGTLQDLRNDKEFGNARQLLQTARAVLIAPRIFKAGFFVGGQGGQAVLMVRGARGWSDPAFYTVGSASFGLQIGAQESELIMFVMSDRALAALLRNKFEIGADAGLAIATLGSEVEGGTTSAAGADIVVWASSSGAYAGISLQGTVISANLGEDRRFYGRPVTTGDIVRRRDAHNPRADGLVRSLSDL